MRGKYRKTGNENFRRILQNENGVITLDDIAQIIALKLYENADNIIVLNGYNDKHDRIITDSLKDNSDYKNRLYDFSLFLKKERENTMKIKRLYPKSSPQYKYYLDRQNDLKKRIDKTLKHVENVNNSIAFSKEFSQIQPIALLVSDSISIAINSAVNKALNIPQKRYENKLKRVTFENIDDYTNNIETVTDFTVATVSVFMDTLTDIEKNILKLLYADFDYRTIADKIGFSKSFVGNTVTKIRKKYTMWTAENK